MLLDELAQRRLPKIRNDRHASTPGCASAFFDRYDDQRRFAPAELTASSQTRLWTPNPCIINLHFTAQRFAPDVDHRPPELMENHPGGLVAGHSELALEQERRDAALVCGHQVGGPKPKGERSLRVVKDSPGRQRNLVPTRSTLPTFLLRQCIRLAVSALTTHEAIRPPAVSQILLARFFAGELCLKFAQRLRKGRARHDPTLLLVAC